MTLKLGITTVQHNASTLLNTHCSWRRLGGSTSSQSCYPETWVPMHVPHEPHSREHSPQGCSRAKGSAFLMSGSYSQPNSQRVPTFHLLIQRSKFRMWGALCFLGKDWSNPLNPTRRDCQGYDKDREDASWLQWYHSDENRFSSFSEPAWALPQHPNASPVSAHASTSFCSHHKRNAQTWTERTVTAPPAEFAYKENKCYRTGKLH